MLDADQFAVDRHGAPALLIRLRLFQLGREFGLLLFEFQDFLFELVDDLLLCLAFT